MTDEDIAAVFAYLKTLKPVRHHVDNTGPPTYSKVCGQMHGSGNQNCIAQSPESGLSDPIRKNAERAGVQNCMFANRAETPFATGCRKPSSTRALSTDSTE